MHPALRGGERRLDAIAVRAGPVARSVCRLRGAMQRRRVSLIVDRTGGRVRPAEPAGGARRGRSARLAISLALLGLPGWLGAFDFSRMLAGKRTAIAEATQQGEWDAYVTGRAWH